jgi:glycosyl-4,4'-diaponeurosporenoate acyltransferase
VELTGFWLLVANVGAWLVVQVCVVLLALRVPEMLLSPRLWFFRAHRWERGGAIYQRMFRVRRWKEALPSGAAVTRGFSIKQVSSHDEAYLERWARESCRAELTHWLCLLALGAFLVWNPPAGDVVNAVYAIAANVPCIVAQRYNRPRLMRLMERRRRLQAQR